MKRFIPSEKKHLTVEAQSVTPSQVQLKHEFGEILDPVKYKQLKMAENVQRKR